MKKVLMWMSREELTKDEDSGTWELTTGNTAHTSRPTAYDALSRYENFEAHTLVNLTAGAGYTNVPEPTSAMLLLLGFAGLARKRKVA